MLAPPVPQLQMRPPVLPRPQVVPQIACGEETTLENWWGMNLEREDRPQQDSRRFTPAEQAAQDLLEGVRMLLAEEALHAIWSGCLQRHKTPAELLVENWQPLLLHA